MFFMSINGFIFQFSPMVKRAAVELFLGELGSDVSDTSEVEVIVLRRIGGSTAPLGLRTMFSLCLLGFWGKKSRFENFSRQCNLKL